MIRLLATMMAVALAAPVQAAGNAAAGQEKSKTCAACHGADGNAPTTPVILVPVGEPGFTYLVMPVQIRS